MSLSSILSYMWYNLQTWVRSMRFRGSCSVSTLPPLGFPEQESCVPLAQIMLWVTKTLEAPATWSEPALKAYTNPFPVPVFFPGLRGNQMMLFVRAGGGLGGSFVVLPEAPSCTCTHTLRAPLIVAKAGGGKPSGGLALGCGQETILLHGPLRNPKILWSFKIFLKICLSRKEARTWSVH